MNKILIVEDDEEIIAGLDRFLSLERFQVTSVNGQKDAVAKLEENAYDVCLVDISLADGSCFKI